MYIYDVARYARCAYAASSGSEAVGVLLAQPVGRSSHNHSSSIVVNAITKH